MTETEEFMAQITETAVPIRATQAYPQDSKCEATSPVMWGDSVQWACLPNGSFRPVGLTAGTLRADTYRIGEDGLGILFIRVRILSDDLLRLPDSTSDRVLDGIARFWQSRARFQAKGQIFKRGVLLWGPPGSGKTATITLLMRDLIDRGGIVIIANGPRMTAQGLAVIRQVEPERPIICVLEDIDEICDEHGQHALLSLLDGENQVGNIVYLASTNYPERLDARLVNRPSRFDEIIKVGMPSAAARRVYLEARLELDERGDIERWISDTDGFSIAHLRELIVAVFCLGREYEETLTRLRAMMRRPPNSQTQAFIGFDKPNGGIHDHG